MAIMICSDCSKEISTEAVSCPQCGASTAHGRAAKEKQYAILISGAGIICGVIAIFTPYKYLLAAAALVLGIISIIKKQRIAGVTSLCLVAFACYQIVQIDKFVSEEQSTVAQNNHMSVAKSDIGAIVQALKLYKLDNQHYPTTEQGLQALVTKPTSGPNTNDWKGAYLDKIPNDPWGNPYKYLTPGTHGEFDVYSLGADGQPGGISEGADIGSWDL